MQKEFNMEKFKENLLDVETEKKDVEPFEKEVALILNLLLREDDISQIDLEDITLRHLDRIEEDVIRILDFVDGDVPKQSIENNLLIKFNFKENVEHIISNKESLRCPNYYDLF